MSGYAKLAVLESGEPAARVLAAVGDLNRVLDDAMTTVVVHPSTQGSRPWYAREADETIGVEPGDAGRLVSTLKSHGVTLVWPGAWPGAEPADLVEACERAGLGLVGPSSAAIRKLHDPAALAEAAAKAGVELAGDADRSSMRAVDVDVIADNAGTVWAVGLRALSVVADGTPVLSEAPLAEGNDAARDTMCHAAKELLEGCGYTGAAVVHFLLDGDQVRLAGVCTRARPDNVLLEETTGIDLVQQRLRVAGGEHLQPVDTTVEGWGVEARLVAQVNGADQVNVLALHLSDATGVRVDTGLRVGDRVEVNTDPVLATVCAHGHSREDALSKLRHALLRTTLVLDTGVSNRSQLLSMIDKLPSGAGAGWYAEQSQSGGLVPPADPLALVAAAIEAYEADLAVVRANFMADAQRGRPQNPEAVGTQVHLDYRGTSYRVRVDRTGADSYRVQYGGIVVDVTIDQIDRYERRITCLGRKRQVIACTQHAVFWIEIDGAVHSVTRVDGAAVRTKSPALVSEVLVSVGQRVAEGDPVAVVESMKMVTTVAAPFPGTVISVDVVANSQVERGASLLRLQGLDTESAGSNDGQVEFSALAGEGGDAAPASPRDVYHKLTNYLLGFDLAPAEVRSLKAAQKSLGEKLPADDAELLAEEDALIDLFAEIGSLYRPHTEAETSGEENFEVGTNAQEYFLAFLQWMDADHAGLPESYRDRLTQALSRYGVHSLDKSPELEAAMLWLFRSFARVPEIAAFVNAILERRLSKIKSLGHRADADYRNRLVRLLAATEGRQRQVADLARDSIFHFFDEPVMETAIAAVESEMAGDLQALRENPQREDRADLVDQLVRCPQPLRGFLLNAWRDSSGEEVGYREALLETYARRYYRIRNLHDLGFAVVDGVQIGYADYEHEGMPVHLVVGLIELDNLGAVASGVAKHRADVPEDRELVVDLLHWYDGTCPPAEEMVQRIRGILSRCDFGGPLHRLDITVTGLQGDAPERDRTQHFTFRQGGDDRFTEEMLYRNMHSMLCKRLDIWRLANFSLERLPSPEDIYLFHGVAHENPKDHRLFALAEVRELGRVEDPETGAIDYPGLGRIGLEALAAMRSALARFPSRERPSANRLILSVRPTWDIPPEQWAELAARYDPLASGVGLERLVVHVQIPGETEGEVEDKVLYVDGIGKGMLSIRLGEPGPNPVRPLTPYAQKVIIAERFGFPYPYEIVRMLTRGEVGSFPPGDFLEMELDADGETLVPANRDPGQNSAHLVVGLLTNYTEVVPEGVRRVAILSDPTMGLGNLAEPECRRINAALAYALEHKMPVEWFACSSGALIAMDSGTENMDWISNTLRRLIEYTQAGGEVNIVVTGINVGGQPYWNAEATMLMHTKGILIMTPTSAMVLTGKQALDFSGATSADDNSGIGGYDRIMGPNGQGQYWAPSFSEACELLLRHYDFTYVVPGERFPRRRPTQDPPERDIREAPHKQVAGSMFTKVGEIMSQQTNAERKRPFDMRSVMRAVSDSDCEPLERWHNWVDSDTSIVWDTTVGGIPVCMLGLESHAVQRKGFVPSYGPQQWTSGTLFPQASRKTARAVNATSGNRPLVVMANLSGFDGSPESMRNWQLEYGAEIGRAITNFQGPIVFVVVSRYHGGAFVVFSKQLNESMEIAAVEGSYASVIGGAPAAATVFARDVKKRTEKDPRVVEARNAMNAASGQEAARLRAKLAAVTTQVRSEKLGEVADEFDSIHTIERAMRVGSVDRIIAANDVRPYVIEALERGMARTLRDLGLES